MSCPHSESDGPCPLCDAGDPALATFITDARPRPSKKDDGLDFGTQVDRYVVHDLIGRGGMGLVYTAHDPDLDRWVAIKLLRTTTAPGDAASLGQARLMREAQAMAQLSHPNVMPVYDVGKYQQAVFVAMELVRGLTLDKWVRAKPRPWPAVLQMFLQAGRGLQAAHAAGLVHRDFKPANVLIGEDGRPRVTDFGIARSVRAPESPQPKSSEVETRDEVPSSSGSSLDTPLTREGALMGSPGYMAPEQYAGLPTSPATDQFSFCVALYEALYGRRPFLGSTFAELAHATTLGHVPAAPKGSAVPPWLHRVLETGLSPEAPKRHASMAVLLEQLADDPVQKLKNRLAIGGVALLVFTLGAAAIWSQVQQRRACRGAEALLAGVWDDAARAKGKKAFEATGKSYAALSWDHARAEMDAYAQAWTRARTEACEATRLRGEQSEEVMAARFGCLDQRKAELAALAHAYGAADVETVDRAYGAASRLSEISSCARARADRKQPPHEAREAALQLGRELAEGRSLISAGKFDPARDHLFTALQIARGLQLPAQQAECELALGELEREVRRLPQANEALERAVRYAEAAADDETAALALTMMVSLVGWRLERPDEGRSLGAIATGKLDRLGGNPRIAAALWEGLGDTEWQAGRRALALTHYRAALTQFTALEGDDGLNVARLRSAVGWVLTEQGALGEARVELMKSKQTREKLLGPEHPALIGNWNELGQLAHSMGDEEESLHAYERMMMLSRLSLGNESLSTSRGALNLVHALVLNDRAAEAEPLLAHTREVLDQHPDAPGSYQLQWQREKGAVETALGRPAEGERWLRQTFALEVKAHGESHPDTALCLSDLARALGAEQKWAEALQTWDRYLAIMEQLGATHDADYAFAIAESAAPLRALSHNAEAVERLERAVALFPFDKGQRRRAALVRFMLAEALPPAEKKRATALALEARAELETGKRVAEVKRIDAWLRKK